VGVRALITLVVAALAVWIFGPVLAGGQSLAFRDAGHYYHPLFNYIRNEWGAGRLPLWNPYENCGVPLLAENTASVFYPGKLLFALPLSFTWLYNLYIVLHVVLAVATSYLLARQLRARRAGALVGGISYAFSGNVLFQYCNVIFLVGAAWLPLALMYADRMLRERCWKSSIGFGVSLALMVLGGDPHMAYNAAIVAACYCVLLWWNDLRSPARCVRARLVSMFAALSCGLLLAALLAAIQILPTLESAPFGERSHYDAPRSIYEYAQTKFSGDTHIEDTPWGLLGHSLHGHDQMLYYFSVEPWRLIELVWPNITGRPFATQRRWLHAFNAEQNIWTPSLYIGLLPVVLALSTWGLRGRSPVVIRGLSWLALLAALASLGWYGCGWCVQLILAADDARAGGQVGGVYWFMATVLPGYVQFRFPAKLWILAGLSLSMLAARGWRQLWRPRNRIVLYLAIVPFASLFVGLFSILVWPLVTGFLVPPPRQAWQGPFNWTGAWTDLADSLIHGSLLSITLVVALRFFQCQPRYRRMLEWAMVAIVAIDLGAAQTHLVEFRVYRDSDVMPSSFNERSSFARMAETIDWEHMTLRPNIPFPDTFPWSSRTKTCRPRTTTSS
jgi:hypothetical protein